jgi:acetylornithine deacetylase/succinyl-diaminopimelate desuccinylase-like protein
VRSEAPRPRADAAEQQLLDIYRELVETDTSAATGETTTAARRLAARLLAAGFPADDVRVLESAPGKGNLVARFRGDGRQRPLLLAAHIDVVEARREDWSVDPFRLIERDGYYYGRGTTDDKAMAASFVANFLRWRQAGVLPARDLILVLTADEELLDVPSNGMRWLLANHRELLDAEFALNEGGLVAMREGRPHAQHVQTGEKLYVNFRLEAQDAGGHSGAPRRDTAITRLAAALGRLAAFDFPARFNDTTRAYFRAVAAAQPDAQGRDLAAVAAEPFDPQALARLGAVPGINAQLRTTCVATRLDGGHADNALPQRAGALVNCRVFPGEAVADVQGTLVAAIADPRVTVTQVGDYTPSAPSPLRADVLDAIATVTARHWPGIPVVPTLSAGATDARFLRNAGIPTYGTSGMALDAVDLRAHGRDERIPVAVLYTAHRYLDGLVRILAGF